MFSDFNQIWSVRKIFAEFPNIKFQANTSSGGRADICGKQTDRQDEANRSFTLFAESA